MNIFCGNLDWALTEDELRAAFEGHGKVDAVRIVSELTSGRSRGYGFVEMPSEDEGPRAMLALDGKELKGRPLRCTRAFRRREEKAT